MKSKIILRTQFFAGFLFFLCQGHSLFAQPVLAVAPKEIRFESRFDGFQKISFYNRGNKQLTIDSIKYGYDRYFFRFNKNPGAKIQIAPHDSLFMDCYLLPFVQIPPNDVDDSLIVYSNSTPAVLYIEIHIDFSEPNMGKGTIRGTVNLPPPPPRATVYFFFNGKYLLDSTNVNETGNFSRDLPQGDYVVGVKTDSSYLTFYPRTTNILEALPVTVGKDITVPINLNPIKYQNTGYSVSGSVIDSISSLPAKKGVVVIKSGIHTPGIASKVSASDTINAFTFFVNPKGDYLADRLPSTGYYYALALCDYFLPSYYNSKQVPALFWEQADSVSVAGSVTGTNIYVSRDSAYGNGTLSGTISNYKSISGGVAGAIIFAKSTDNNKMYLSGNSSSTGDFTLYDLPYGTYSLLVQRFGYQDIFSPSFSIDSANPSHKNIQIMYPAGVETSPTASKTYLILNNYPNPFNPSTVISYTLPYETDVQISVFSAIGQKVADLLNAHQRAGTYKINFTLENRSSGIYFIRLKTLNEQKIIKAVAIK